MGIRRILVDESLLLDMLMGHRLPTTHSDLLWDLFTQGHLEGFVTDLALAQAGRYAMSLKDQALAESLVTHLCHHFVCCLVEPSTFQAAEQSDLSLSFAIQVAIAEALDLDGIVTHQPLNYAQDSEFSDILIYTPEQLLAEYPQGQLEASRRKLEIQYNPALPGLCQAQVAYLEQVEVCCGRSYPIATVTLQTPHGLTYQETASGVGPIDATFRALNLAVNQFEPVSDVAMVYYRSLATTADSEVSAMVLLQRNHSLYAGRGFHPDLMMASASAYIDALSYLLYCDSL
ncbi:MAG: hypothetical protein HC922_04070 [Leptolyngbyaceae cyanobacterium SM2_3_12]|nr:hypothetical protein [Leptolyngbyaceae cyanobacterium SM2_3_12]